MLRYRCHSINALTIANVSGAKITELQCKKLNSIAKMCILFVVLLFVRANPSIDLGACARTRGGTRHMGKTLSHIASWELTIFIPWAGPFFFCCCWRRFLSLSAVFTPSIDKLRSFPKWLFPWMPQRALCRRRERETEPRILEVNGCTEALVIRKIDYCSSDRRQFVRYHRYVCKSLL